MLVAALTGDRVGLSPQIALLCRCSRSTTIGLACHLNIDVLGKVVASARKQNIAMEIVQKTLSVEIGTHAAIFDQQQIWHSI